ncbi:MAG TPA: DUF4112 domain-containing protein [Candidatus Limnocylindrales bacterium]|nr:DUF4112 domain-containing protein [Candidatus Limnocylindrales bacterium]
MDRTQTVRPQPGRVDPRRTERILAAERRIASVAHLLDDLVAIPGTRQRVGLDPIIGLIPFLGDLVSGVVAAWIVLEAARFKLPTIVLLRMIMYATVDFLVGLIPILGDLFDIGFKANTRNLELFHRHAVDPGASTASSWAIVGGVALVFVGVLWLGIVLIGRFISFLLAPLGA